MSSDFPAAKKTVDDVSNEIAAIERVRVDAVPDHISLCRRVDDLGELAAAEEASALRPDLRTQASDQLLLCRKQAILSRGVSRELDLGHRGRSGNRLDRHPAARGKQSNPRVERALGFRAFRAAYHGSANNLRFVTGVAGPASISASWRNSSHDRALRHGQGQRLAGIGRCPRGFRIVRKARVERLGDPLLELALADQSALAGGAGLDQPEANLRRLVPHQGLQSDRVAQAGEAALAHDDNVACRAEHDALYRVCAARQIDDDPGKFSTQLVEQHVDRAGVDDQMLGRRRLGGQHQQIVGHLDHGALDEEAVDAGRLLQRLAQPAAGIGIELERDGAEMEIEIDERHPLAALLGEQPGAGNGGCRRADAAAAADEDDHLPQSATGPRSRISRPFLQGSRQGLTGRPV